MIIYLDLINGAVIFVGKGKGAEASEAFWENLERSEARAGAPAIEVSPAYISAVFENLKGATIVFDHSHIIKLYNE